MNTGIQDAHNLGWKLALVEKGISGEVLLDSYPIERRPVAAAICASGEAFEGLQELEDDEAIQRRDTALAAIDLDPQASRYRAEAACELTANYRDSPIVVGDPAPWPRAPSPGDRLPDAGFVVSPSGENVGVQDACYRPEHTLLCVLADTPPNAAEDLRTLHEVAARNADLVGGVVVVARHATADEGLAGTWHVAEGTTPFEALGVASVATFVVRPDRFVATRSNDLCGAPVEEFLAALRLGRVG